jgi:hypothetical protein
LEEAKLIWFAGQKYWETSRDSITFDELVERRKELLQSQPKVFDIEVQMEYWKESTIYDQPDKSLDNPKPKITNNSIKIIKKLN